MLGASSPFLKLYRTLLPNWKAYSGFALNVFVLKTVASIFECFFIEDIFCYLLYYVLHEIVEHLVVIRLETGEICHKIKLGYSRQYTEDEPTSLEFTSCAEKSSQVAALVNDSVVIYDVETAEKKAKVKDPYLEKGDTYENSGNIVGKFVT